jgi:hypothetical protein
VTADVPPQERPDLTTRAWRKLTSQMRASAKANGTPCSLCGLPIDFTASPRTRWSFSVDHVHAVWLGGDVRGDLAVAHFHSAATRARAHGCVTGGRHRSAQRRPATGETKPVLVRGRPAPARIGRDLSLAKTNKRLAREPLLDRAAEPLAN